MAGSRRNDDWPQTARLVWLANAASLRRPIPTCASPLHMCEAFLSLRFSRFPGEPRSFAQPLSA